MPTEPSKITESVVEQTALAWFETLGYDIEAGPSISPGEAGAERDDYGQVVLPDRLQAALAGINPTIPPDAIDEAFRKITRTDSPSLIESNRRFHRMLTDGVDVSYLDDGREVHDKVWLLDVDDVENNDWLAVNQFTVVEDRKTRRPDVVVFVNGLPLGLIELKNPADEKATIRQAFNQLQTYKADIPGLFVYNELLVVSDGLEARGVEDGATVPIYYESRLAKIGLREEEKPNIDPAFEQITEGEEETTKQRLRTKWAALEAMVGTKKRIDLIARDFVDHFEGRLSVMDGKAMFVCMSRRICVEIYNAIIRLRPEWHSDDDDKGAVKIIMSGSAADGKTRYLQEVNALSKAFALAVPHEKALAIRDDVGFFQEVRAGLAKATVEGEGKSPEEVDSAIRQLVSRAVASEGVVDIFAAAGLKKPDISILSDDFLQEVRELSHRNLAVELLRKLLKDEIKTRSGKNVVQARSFADMLEKAVLKYQNRAIETAQVIEELIDLAREMREARNRGEDLGMNDDEIAFYDALEVNDSAVKVLGDDTLKTIAQELVKAVRRSVSIDWTVRENARAQIRVMVKRILRRYGYPPDKQEKATQTVLEQAEVLCREWAEAA